MLLLLVQVLAAARPNPGPIAVDAKAVYWIESDNGGLSSHLMSVPKRGGPVTRLGVAGGGELLSDGESLFFVDLAGIHRVQPGNVPSPLATGEGAVDLHLSAAWLYWRNAFGQLRRIARSGGFAETVREHIGFAVPFAVDDDGFYAVADASGIVTSGDSIFYAVRGVRAYKRGLVPSSGWIARIGRSGGPASVLAERQNAPAGEMAVVNGSLYWINRGDRMLVRMPIEGGAVEPIARAVRFAIEASAIYAVTPEGDIVRAALDDRSDAARAGRRADALCRTRRRPAGSFAARAIARRDRE